MKNSGYFKVNQISKARARLTAAVKNKLSFFLRFIVFYIKLYKNFENKYDFLGYELMNSICMKIYLNFKLVNVF